jgi:hypothetical protein
LPDLDPDTDAYRSQQQAPGPEGHDTVDSVPGAERAEDATRDPRPPAEPSSDEGGHGVGTHHAEGAGVGGNDTASRWTSSDQSQPPTP